MFVYPLYISFVIIQIKKFKSNLTFLTLMKNENKEFIDLMLKKTKEKTSSEIKGPFDDVDVEEVENLTRELMEKKPKK